MGILLALIPRALPWAIIHRPFRAEQSGRLRERSDSTLRQVITKSARPADESLTVVFSLNDFYRFAVSHARPSWGMRIQYWLIRRFVLKQFSLDSPESQKSFQRCVTIIDSMTPAERETPASVLLNPSRQERIATGSGTSRSAVREVIQYYQQMRRMMDSFED